jgi:acetyl esterase/lipase
MRRALLTVPLCLLSFGLAGCQSAFFATLNAGTGAAPEVHRYGDLPSQVLDVYRPSGDGSAPIVVFLYGGRWQKGTRHDYAFVGKALAARGVTTLIVDYRYYPEVRFPTFVQDAALAVGWAREHAAQIGGDADRVFLAGHSAGAHIAALIGTDARYLRAVDMQPRDLAGVIGIAGPYDFLPLREDDLKEIFGPETRWPESQPVNFVDGDEPPFLLLHGSDDKLVWPRNSAALNARLRAAGDRVDYRTYPDLGHIRILGALRYPRLAPTLADTVQFIEQMPAPR